MIKKNVIKGSLLIILVTLLCLSCKKEDYTVYSFVDYSFTENIKCYDTLGNQLDSSSYMFSEVDFIYNDGYHIPYKNIEIIENNTFIINYTSEGNPETLNGIINQKNDSVYFYRDKFDPYNLIFEGKIIDNQLKITGCGYIYFTYIEDAITLKTQDRTTTLLIPDIKNLLNDFPEYTVNHNKGNRYLYFQKFDLIYEKTSE